ncbi:MAG: endonuclease/exonuclease/phosphatase family protein [Pseudomonadales bacterium]
MPLRIATYNVQNLFAEGDVGYTKSMVACKAVARVLDLMAADVVALQEVGSLEALEALNALLRTPYAHIGWQPGNSTRGIHLAYLSRLPLALQSHALLPLLDTQGQLLMDHALAPAEPTTAPEPLLLQRDLLRATLLNNHGVALGLDLFNVHLKSKTNQTWRLLASDDIRAAEARAVAAALQALETGSESGGRILLGDFNDLLSADALTPLRALQWQDAVLFDRAQQGATGRAPGTYWPRRRLRIDHVLLNPGALGGLVPGSAVTHASTLAQRGSDHYPISVDLEVLAD